MPPADSTTSTSSQFIFLFLPQICLTEKLSKPLFLVSTIPTKYTLFFRHTLLIISDPKNTFRLCPRREFVLLLLVLVTPSLSLLRLGSINILNKTSAFSSSNVIPPRVEHGYRVPDYPFRPDPNQLNWLCTRRVIGSNRPTAVLTSSPFETSFLSTHGRTPSRQPLHRHRQSSRVATPSHSSPTGVTPWQSPSVVLTSHHASSYSVRRRRTHSSPRNSRHGQTHGVVSLSSVGLWTQLWEVAQMQVQQLRLTFKMLLV
ncbi:hypothetical protein PIB30_070329 [Stylosanthes scabra]|uniref:Uncharacterized protein n=1 Tax=Stylosanthes scabra TaxID=79078 RepID=A0ABU6RPM8_9FABA|nr:hypothetical protein [Stylosanthes scabra]